MKEEKMTGHNTIILEVA